MIELHGFADRRHLLFGFVVALSALACDREPVEARLGTRLGMTPPQVRSSVSVPGSFSVDVAGATDLVLRFAPTSPDDRQSGVTAAQFEFHGGVLVAVRAELIAGSALAAGPTFEVTPNAVTRRISTDGAPKLHWISRHCPVHAAEVAQLLEQQR